MQSKNPCVGRFAPSPSGRMHLGNAFSALVAWLSVRSAGGEMVLRIEDLDKSRCRAEYTPVLKDDLLWLGLDWDREVQKQSERDEVYEEALEKLRAMGLAFPCWCTRGELHASSAPHASDGHWIYPGTCRNLTAVEIAKKQRTPSWRVMVPDERVEFEDGVYGTVGENLARECGDFVVKKADGSFAYQLAVVTDDIACGVTQVVRGCDLLSSTARQIYLIKLLGGTVPRYCHVPLLTAPDGRRLSKRERDLDLGALKERTRPENVIGALAFAAGLTDSPAPVSPRELVKDFSWQKLKKENIVWHEDML